MGNLSYYGNKWKSLINYDNTEVKTDFVNYILSWPWYGNVCTFTFNYFSS